MPSCARSSQARTDRDRRFQRRSLCTLAIAFHLLLTLTGCISPAQPDEFAHEPEPELPLGGHYDATFHTVFVGSVKGRVMAEATDAGVKANTRPGIAWTMIGGVEGAAGPLFAPFIFPRGMILTWESSLPKDGQPGRGTLGIATLAALRVPTVLHSTRGPIEVRFRDDRLIGLIALDRIDVPENVQPPPPKTVDYAALVDRAREALPKMLFDPVMAESDTVKNYLSDLQEGASKAQDDIEFLFITGLAARKHIKFGFPLMYPRGNGSMSPVLARHTDAPRPFKVSFDESTRIATIRFDFFVEDAWVDDAFTQALAQNPRGLILDLRSSPGITLAALRSMRWLADRPLMGHLLIGPDRFQSAPGVTWRSALVQSAPPEAAEAQASNASAASIVKPEAGSIFYTMINASTSQDVLLTRLADDDILAVAMMPQRGAYTGPVVLLTSRRTSSTAEMLAEILSRSGRATLVGENTGGRPSLTTEVDIGQGWMLRAPSYQYFGKDGSLRLGKGLTPSIRATREAAPKAAADFILKQLETTAQASSTNPPEGAPRAAR
jgi:hypothetical protein